MMPEKAREPEMRRHPSSGRNGRQPHAGRQVRRIAAGAQPERSVPVGSPAGAARTSAGRAKSEGSDAR